MKHMTLQLQRRMLGVEERVSLAPPCIIVVLECLIVLGLSEKQKLAEIASCFEQRDWLSLYSFSHTRLYAQQSEGQVKRLTTGCTEIKNGFIHCTAAIILANTEDRGASHSVTYSLMFSLKWCWKRRFHYLIAIFSYIVFYSLWPHWLHVTVDSEN